MNLLGLSSPALFTGHRGQSGGRGLSPRLWDMAYGQGLSPDGLANAFSVGDDFLNFGAVNTGISGATAGVVHGGYGWYADTATSACSIKQLATEIGGVARIQVAATDNHEAWLTSGGNSGVLGVISDTAGDDKRLIFETRVRFGQIVTFNSFIGLSEEGLAAADTITDAGALASKDLIGFHIAESASSTLTFTYRKAGQTAVIPIAALKTIVAATWYKLGFIYDPAAPSSQRIRIFLDNEEQTTKVTGTNIAAATFPDAEELAFLAGVKTSSTASPYMDIDWWNFWQAGQ